jgi:hypothetical protein
MDCSGEPAAQAAPALTMEALSSRLRLTPEQEAQVRPLVDEHRKRIAEIRANLERDHSSRSKRGLLLEEASIQEDFNSKLKSLLTDEQRTEWQRIRGEIRHQLKERWRDE